MPLFDDDITGADFAVVGANCRLDHLTVTITTFGPSVSRPSVDAPDHVIRVGFLALGWRLDDGLGELDYWEAPIWIAFEQMIYPEPNATEINFNLIRWCLSPGMAGHLIVNGFEL